jgi:hypothetical protein
MGTHSSRRHWQQQFWPGNLGWNMLKRSLKRAQLSLLCVYVGEWTMREWNGSNSMQKLNSSSNVVKTPRHE